MLSLNVNSTENGGPSEIFVIAHTGCAEAVWAQQRRFNNISTHPASNLDDFRILLPPFFKKLTY
jgi:hypothetical protein